ncbi:MAG: hypothetical protein WCO09_00765 [bacterium]
MTATSIERNTDRFNKLPNDYQEAIKTSDYDNQLSIIAKEHKLHIDQSATLEKVLAELIFGEIKPEHMVSEVSTRLSIPTTEAKTLTIELNQLIIKPIKENLKKIQLNVQEKEDLE